MKIAITSKGTDLDSEVDPRFGRASYIIIVDTDSLDFEILDNNENKNAFKGAGIKAASMISEKGVSALLTGYCGPNAFTTLQAAEINVANDVSGIVRDAVAAFNKGEYKYSENPNAEGQWT
ncbi:MAG: dinitrogenase iron-molybdenum cofactor biosynthesis protein [Deltaproteobacteria bacterium]|nr:MAG: dinitrogenase iron-molybdenum cofactor biosynthesis protein [Deltaproteobacteria bacterium]